MLLKHVAGNTESLVRKLWEIAIVCVLKTLYYQGPTTRNELSFLVIYKDNKN